MPILSTVSAGFTNVGNDLQVFLTGFSGVPTFLPNVMQFKWVQRTIPIDTTQMNGLPLYAEIPNGFEGSIDFHRSSGVYEDVMTDIQQNWINNGTPLFGIVTLLALGADGLRTFIFTNATIKMDDGGTWVGDDVTRCTLSFRASTLQ